MRRREEFEPYVKHIASAMGLKDWSISVSPDPPPDSIDHATVERIKGRRVARLRLSELFLRSDEEEQRDTIVHELIHVQGSFVDTYLIDRLTDAEFLSFRTLREYEVDAQAAAFAPLLPLPSEVLATESRESRPITR